MDVVPPDVRERVSAIVNVVSSVFLAIGCLVLVANFCAIYATIRNRRRGIDKHVSTVPVVTQFFVVLAAMTSRHTGHPWFPGGSSGSSPSRTRFCG